MIKISYDTTGQDRKFDEVVFEIFGNISGRMVERDIFNPNMIYTYVDDVEDARYAECEIRMAEDRARENNN